MVVGIEGLKAKVLIHGLMIETLESLAKVDGPARKGWSWSVIEALPVVAWLR